MPAPPRKKVKPVYFVHASSPDHRSVSGWGPFVTKNLAHSLRAKLLIADPVDGKRTVTISEHTVDDDVWDVLKRAHLDRASTPFSKHLEGSPVVAQRRWELEEDSTGSCEVPPKELQDMIENVFVAFSRVWEVADD